MERRALIGAIVGTAVFAAKLTNPLELRSGMKCLRPHHLTASARYARAKEFLTSLEHSVDGDISDFLYRAGVVAQLVITAFLFDRGISDEWCQENIGLNISKALASANYLGLGFDSCRTSSLFGLLSPYGQWRRPFLTELPDTSRVSSKQAMLDIRHLSEHVHGRLA